MWQRFSENARRVVFFAQEEAGQLGENYVSTEHLLLGIAREEDTTAARVLENLGVPPMRIRREITRQVSRGDGRSGVDMQLTPRGKRVLDLAFDESRTLGNEYIGSEHLLLGLIREGEGLAGRVLKALGVELEAARQAVYEVQRATRGTQSSPRRWPGVGDLGVLKTDEDHAVVELAIDSRAFVELSLIRAAKDSIGYRELYERGQFKTASVGVRLKRLQTPVDAPKGFTDAIYVRILGGELQGRAGWISASNFECTDEEDEPFPPDLPDFPKEDR